LRGYVHGYVFKHNPSEVKEKKTIGKF
jgi:hypothetical protein